jgi:hypothetical protein
MASGAGRIWPNAAAGSLRGWSSASALLLVLLAHEGGVQAAAAGGLRVGCSSTRELLVLLPQHAGGSVSAAATEACSVLPLVFG